MKPPLEPYRSQTYATIVTVIIFGVQVLARYWMGILFVLAFLSNFTPVILGYALSFWIYRDVGYIDVRWKKVIQVLVVCYTLAVFVTYFNAWNAGHVSPDEVRKTIFLISFFLLVGLGGVEEFAYFQEKRMEKEEQSSSSDAEDYLNWE